MRGTGEIHQVFLARKLEGKRPHGRPKHRWKDNIKIYLKEIGWERVDWINLAEDKEKWQAVVKLAVNIRVS
jgi:hypothetical protein